MAAKVEKWTAKLLTERLQRHYIAPGQPLNGGVFLGEVTMNSQGGRRVDALYVGFTSTRGHHMVGHEIKVSRADWLHELAQPDKAEVWASQCHAWYVVAPSTDIVRVEELPHGWGLMVPNARTTTRLDIVVKAELHPDRQPSWDTVHSVLKKMDTGRANAIADAKRKAQRDAGAEMERLVELRVGQVTGVDQNARKVVELQKILDQVATALGIENITSGYDWSNSFPVEHLGPAIGTYLEASRDIDRALGMRMRQIQNAEHFLSGAVEEVRSARAIVEKAIRHEDA